MAAQYRLSKELGRGRRTQPKLQQQQQQQQQQQWRRKRRKPRLSGGNPVLRRRSNGGSGTTSVQAAHSASTPALASGTRPRRRSLHAQLEDLRAAVQQGEADSTARQVQPVTTPQRREGQAVTTPQRREGQAVATPQRRESQAATTPQLRSRMDAFLSPGPTFMPEVLSPFAAASSSTTTHARGFLSPLAHNLLHGHDRLRDQQMASAASISKPMLNGAAYARLARAVSTPPSPHGSVHSMTTDGGSGASTPPRTASPVRLSPHGRSPPLGSPLGSRQGSRQGSPLASPLGSARTRPSTVAVGTSRRGHTRSPSPVRFTVGAGADVSRVPSPIRASPTPSPAALRKRVGFHGDGDRDRPLDDASAETRPGTTRTRRRSLTTVQGESAVKLQARRIHQQMLVQREHEHEIKLSLLDDWQRCFDREQTSFTSVALECELRLKRCRLFVDSATRHAATLALGTSSDAAAGQALASAMAAAQSAATATRGRRGSNVSSARHPLFVGLQAAENAAQVTQLVTAVGFDVFDTLMGALDRYRPLLRDVRDIFLHAVYTPAAVSSVPPPSLNGSKALVRYYNRVPYFVAYKQKQEELKVASAQVKESQEAARSARAAVQAQRAASTKTKATLAVMNKWKVAAAKARTSAAKSALQKVHSALEQTENKIQELEADGPAAVIMDLCATMDDDVSLVALFDRMLQSVPDGVREAVAARLLRGGKQALLNAAQRQQMAFEALAQDAVDSTDSTGETEAAGAQPAAVDDGGIDGEEAGQGAGAHSGTDDTGAAGTGAGGAGASAGATNGQLATSTTDGQHRDATRVAHEALLRRTLDALARSGGVTPQLVQELLQAGIFGVGSHGLQLLQDMLLRMMTPDQQAAVSDFLLGMAAPLHLPPPHVDSMQHLPVQSLSPGGDESVATSAGPSASANAAGMSTTGVQPSAADVSTSSAQPSVDSTSSSQQPVADASTSDTTAGGTDGDSASAQQSSDNRTRACAPLPEAHVAKLANQLGAANALRIAGHAMGVDWHARLTEANVATDTSNVNELLTVLMRRCLCRWPGSKIAALLKAHVTPAQLQQAVHGLGFVCDVCGAPFDGRDAPKQVEETGRQRRRNGSRRRSSNGGSSEDDGEDGGSDSDDSNKSDSDDDLEAAKRRGRRRRSRRRLQRGSTLSPGMSMRARNSILHSGRFKARVHKAMEYHMNPFWKLVGLGGKGHKAKKISKFGLMAIIGDVLDKKMELIASGDELGLQAMPQIVNDHLIQKYGLQSLVDRYMVGIRKGVMRWNAKNVWIRLFGFMTGILDEKQFSPILADWILRAVKELVPSFKGIMVRKKGQRRRSSVAEVATPQAKGAAGQGTKDMTQQQLRYLRRVPLQRALDVVKVVFPEQPIGMCRDRRWLHPSRRKQLVDRLFALAGGTGAKVAAPGKPRSRKRSSIAAVFGRAAGAGAGAGAGTGAGTGAGDKAGDAFSKMMLLSREIKFSAFLDACVHAWREQSEADTIGMEEVYEEFDYDGNGVLSYTEFSALLGACSAVPIPNAVTLKLFRQVHSLDGQNGDVISPEAFIHLCLIHGITPPSDWEDSHNALAPAAPQVSPQDSPHAAALPAVSEGTEATGHDLTGAADTQAGSDEASKAKDAARTAPEVPAAPAAPTPSTPPVAKKASRLKGLFARAMAIKEKLRADVAASTSTDYDVDADGDGEGDGSDSDDAEEEDDEVSIGSSSDGE